MRLETSEVISDLADMGIDAEVIDDTFNVNYLRVIGNSYMLDVLFNTEADDTLDFDYLDGAYRTHKSVDPWNVYSVDLANVDSHDELVAALDRFTK